MQLATVAAEALLLSAVTIWLADHVPRFLPASGLPIALVLINGAGLTVGALALYVARHPDGDERERRGRKMRSAAMDMHPARAGASRRFRCIIVPEEPARLLPAPEEET